MSTANVELQSSTAVVDNGAAARCRAVLTALFGEPRQRSFDVRFWDGAVDRGCTRRRRLRSSSIDQRHFAACCFHRTSCRSSNRTSAATSTSTVAWKRHPSSRKTIGGRLRSPLAIARLVGLVLGLPGQAEDDLAAIRFPEQARKLARATRPCAMRRRFTTTTTSATVSTSCGSISGWFIRARTSARPTIHWIPRRKPSSI